MLDTLKYLSFICYTMLCNYIFSKKYRETENCRTHCVGIILTTLIQQVSILCNCFLDLVEYHIINDVYSKHKMYWRIDYNISIDLGSVIFINLYHAFILTCLGTV